MLEFWLENQQSNFHYLVKNTEVIQPLQIEREQTLKYLKLINSFNKFYSNLCNYDLIDYQRLIYIENIYQDDEEIIQLIKEIKARISDSYIYKHKYIKRITNPIPRERFDSYYDEYLVDSLEINTERIYNKKKEKNNTQNEGLQE